VGNVPKRTGVFSVTGIICIYCFGFYNSWPSSERGFELVKPHIFLEAGIVLQILREYFMEAIEIKRIEYLKDLV
jgi:hypothetical protein